MVKTRINNGMKSFTFKRFNGKGSTVNKDLVKKLETNETRFLKIMEARTQQYEQYTKELLQLIAPAMQGVVNYLKKVGAIHDDSTKLVWDTVVPINQTRDHIFLQGFATKVVGPENLEIPIQLVLPLSLLVEHDASKIEHFLDEQRFKYMHRAVNSEVNNSEHDYVDNQDTPEHQHYDEPIFEIEKLTEHQKRALVLTSFTDRKKPN